MCSLWPTIPFVPVSGSLPPMTAEGSKPASMRICVSIELEVVLPWVPLMQMQSG